MAGKVYNKRFEERVKANHREEGVYYVVGFAMMDWTKGKGNVPLEPCVYVVMEYNGVVNYASGVAHISTVKNPDGSTDLENVLAKIEVMKKDPRFTMYRE